MGSRKICKNEQEALLSIKAALVNEAWKQYKKGNIPTFEFLLQQVDAFPALESGIQVQKRCTPCTFPKCDAGKILQQILKQLEIKKFEPLPELIQRLHYYR